MKFANYHIKWLSILKELELKDGTIVVARPLEQNDKESLSEFFSEIPRSDLLIYKEDLSSRDKFESWFTNQSYSKVLQLVCEICTKIVAKATLYNEGLYWSDAAEIKLIVHPEYRGAGLGSQMFHILLNEGINKNFRKIIVRYAVGNMSFSKILSRYSFEPETVLNSYIKDEDAGVAEDLIIASYNLENWDRRFEFYYPTDSK